MRFGNMTDEREEWDEWSDTEMPNLDCDSNPFRGFIYAFFFTALLALVIFGLYCLAGCAVASPSPQSAHPMRQVSQSLAGITNSLKGLNVLGILGFALGAAAAIYGLVTADKLIEYIGFGAGIAGGVLALTSLFGLIVLPFAPWILGGVGILLLGIAAYLIYVKFFAVKTAAAAAVKA